jgi:ParB family chromosome partitioning protein
MQQALSHLDADSISYVDPFDVAQASWTLRPIDEQRVVELMRSIRHAGLLQPIVLRTSGGAYEVVFGNHRLEACKRLGMRQVPAIVKDMCEEEAFLARVSENLIRNSYVDPLEESKGYRMLVSRGWTINAIGCKVGKSDSYISERLRLVDRLSPNLRRRLSSRELSASHAEIIARIKDPARQEEVADWVRRRKISVRSLERMLTRAPLPARVELREFQGECYVRVPREFLDAMALATNQTVLMYSRGCKLILDNVERIRGTRESKKAAINGLFRPSTTPPFHNRT